MKTQRHKEKEHHVKKKAEMGVLYLHAKEHQGLLASPEARERQATDSPSDTTKKPLPSS